MKLKKISLLIGLAGLSSFGFSATTHNRHHTVVGHSQTASTDRPSAQAGAINAKGTAIEAKATAKNQSHVASNYFFNGVTVTTSNAFDLRSAYDASDLIVNLPSMNEDLVLLKQHQKFDQLIDQSGRDIKAEVYKNKALLEFSGAVAVGITTGTVYDYGVVSATVSNNSVASTTGTSYLSLNQAQINANFFINPWVGGMIEIGKTYGVYSHGALVNRAWFTIGNLAKSPFYMSAGLDFVPFGKYSSSMSTYPITLTIFRTRTPNIVLGYDNGNAQREFYAQAYVFQSSVAEAGSRFAQGGVNLGANMQVSHSLKADIGAGVISDLSTTGGFSGALGAVTSMSDTRSPGVDVHMGLSWALSKVGLGFKAEYIRALKKSDNLFFNPNGAVTTSDKATPAAMHVEADLTSNLYHRPVGVFVSYGRSWQALGVNRGYVIASNEVYGDATVVPEQTIAVGFNTSIWRDTIESIEYRHDIGYGAHAHGGAVGVAHASNISQGGNDQNIVSIQMGVYF